MNDACVARQRSICTTSPNPPNVLVPGMGASSVREWIASKSQRDAAGRAGGEGYVGLTVTTRPPHAVVKVDGND